MQLKAQSLKRRLVQAIVLRGYLLCLLEVLQRMGENPSAVAAKEGDPITRSKTSATGARGLFCYISVASLRRRERSRRIENTTMVTTARKTTTMSTLIAASRNPPRVTIEPSKVVTSRISAAIPPSALTMNAMD